MAASREHEEQLLGLLCLTERRDQKRKQCVQQLQEETLVNCLFILRTGNEDVW